VDLSRWLVAWGWWLGAGWWRNAPHLASIGDRAIDRNHHIDGERFVPRRTELDPMRAGRKRQAGHRAARLFNGSDEAAVDVHLRRRRLDHQP
jgi:hypothetical protein